MNENETYSEPCDDPSSVPPSQALAVRDTIAAVERLPDATKPTVTAAQAKIEAIASLTQSAYARASELKLTREEVEALQADFPDEAFKPGAAGKENLIYIEHAFLRDRLNTVIGIGQWALIPRNRWGEDYKTAKGFDATRIYVEAMLMVRGCFVSEAVGEMSYFPHNESQNYGDAVEGAKTAALRRCCKEFGIGLQAWKKDWCAGWWARRTNRGEQRIEHPRNQPPKTQPAKAVATKPPPPPVTVEHHPAKKPPPKWATEATRTWMVEQLTTFREVADEYFRKINQLLPNEHIEDLPLEYVPINREQLAALQNKMREFADGDEAERAFDPNPQPLPGKQEQAAKAAAKAASDDPNDPDSPNAAWRSFPMPFGKNAGTVLAELDKKYLYGLWANFAVETEYEGKPKRPETIARDEGFRRVLDAAGQHYNFTKNE